MGDQPVGAVQLHGYLGNQADIHQAGGQRGLRQWVGRGLRARQSGGRARVKWPNECAHVGSLASKGSGQRGEEESPASQGAACKGCSRHLSLVLGSRPAVTTHRQPAAESPPHLSAEEQRRSCGPRSPPGVKPGHHPASTAHQQQRQPPQRSMCNSEMHEAHLTVTLPRPAAKPCSPQGPAMPTHLQHSP